MLFVLPNLGESPAFLGWLNICLPMRDGEPTPCLALLAHVALDLPSLSQLRSFFTLLSPFSAQFCCWGSWGGAVWFFAAGWGEITREMHPKLWQRGSPVPKTPSLWSGGCCRSCQMCCLPILEHICVWSLGWGCSLGSPAAANEGRALLLVPALLPVTTQKLFKWN